MIFWTGSDIFRLVLSRLFSLRFASFVLATNLRSWYVACGKGVEQKDQHTIVCLFRRLPLNFAGRTIAVRTSSSNESN